MRLAHRVARCSMANGKKTGLEVAENNLHTNFAAAEEAVAIITKAENGAIDEQNETRV